MASKLPRSFREWMKLTQKYPFVRRLLFSTAHKYAGRKAVAGFLFGGTIAYVFGGFLIGQLPLSAQTSRDLLVITVLILSTLNAMFSQARCLTLLLIPTVLSNSGALYLKCVALASVISGPVENLLLNGQEVSNTITCTTELVKNLTVFKYRLTYMPYQQALMNLEVDVNEVTDAMASVKEVLAPLTFEFLDDTEIKYIKNENDYWDQIQDNTLRSKEIESRYYDEKIFGSHDFNPKSNNWRLLSKTVMISSSEVTYAFGLVDSTSCLKTRRTFYSGGQGIGHIGQHQVFQSHFGVEEVIRQASNPKNSNTSGAMIREIAKAIEDFYMKKLDYRCNNLVTESIKKCRKMFTKAYEYCSNSFPGYVSELLCWPMKRNYICSIVAMWGDDNQCDATREMSRGWGAGLVALLKTKLLLSVPLRHPEVLYRIHPPDVHVDADKQSEQTDDLKQRFEDHSHFYVKFMHLLRIALNLIFLKVIYDTFDYHGKYLTDIEFANVYVSRYFKKIDFRRLTQGKHVLLPFKSREKHRFIFPSKVALQKREVQRAFYGLMLLLPLFFFVTGLVMIDKVFSEAMKLIARNAVVEFVPTGHQEMKLTVQGSGMIAKIVKSVVEGFYFASRTNITQTNEECLPKAHVLKFSTHLGIYSVLLACAFVLIVDGYGSRLKWAICEFFYPQRAKKRSLFLYNSTLKKRKVFFKYMNTKVKRMIRANKLDQDTSTMLLISMKYPRYFGWLPKFFDQARRKCLICRVPEDLGFLRNDVVMFECQECLYVYCKECFDDIGRRCHRCRPLMADEDSDPDSVLTTSEKWE